MSTMVPSPTQPDTGQFWNKVYDNVRGQVPKVKITSRAQYCQHGTTALHRGLDPPHAI
jgi:hypothetical protein